MDAGSIVHLFFSHLNPPKNKLAVLLHVSPRVGFFLINTRINLFVNNRPELVKANITVPYCDHNCLNHDSYLDCTDVHGGYTPDELELAFTQNPQIVRGHLSEACRQEMLGEVNESRLLPQIKKDWILAAFS